ncbi:MAG: hypothetical protein R3C40_08050 [Parvularculaceae bacterium]
MLKGRRRGQQVRSAYVIHTRLARASRRAFVVPPACSKTSRARPGLSIRTLRAGPRSPGLSCRGSAGPDGLPAAARAAQFRGDRRLCAAAASVEFASETLKRRLNEFFGPGAIERIVVVRGGGSAEKPGGLSRFRGG